MPYTCPKCGMTSYNPEDEKNKYCGNCHRFEGIGNFHDHLDICEQCRNHCFDLCPIGARLLREAVESVSK